MMHVIFILSLLLLSLATSSSSISTPPPVPHLALRGGIPPTAPQSGLTADDKKRILYVFNYARATTKVPASNMKKMIWDDDIARKAQAYTDRCMSVWDPTFIPYAFAYRDHAYDPVGVAKWRTWRMAPFYDFATGQCDDSPLSKRVCRHPENYRKVVMSGNTRVGCGKTVCGPGPKGVFHMCGIAGSDYVVNEPWAIGARCSACPADYKFCDHGLCSKTLSLNGSQGDWFYVPKTTKIGWY